MDGKETGEKHVISRRIYLSEGQILGYQIKEEKRRVKCLWETEDEFSSIELNRKGRFYPILLQ